jgi:hypothetical protein
MTYSRANKVEHESNAWLCTTRCIYIDVQKFHSAFCQLTSLLKSSLSLIQLVNNMQLLLSIGFLPLSLAAAIRGRQSSSVSAFSGWSAPDQTYDGTQILGTFESEDNANSSSPGVTQTDYSDSAQESSRHLNVSVQNLVPSLSIEGIFVAVHSDNVALFEIGKPVSEEISDFISNGNNSAFDSLRTGPIYGAASVNDGSSGKSLEPGQYLNFSVPLSLPSRVNNEKLADALDDLDASLTVIGRLKGLSQAFFAVDGSDLGDKRESATATVYSVAAGFLTVHSGYVNSSVTFAATSGAQVLTFAG